MFGSHPSGLWIGFEVLGLGFRFLVWGWGSDGLGLRATEKPPGWVVVLGGPIMFSLGPWVLFGEGAGRPGTGHIRE